MGRELTGQGNLTAAQEQERLAKSTNSIFNQGGEPPPQDVIDAYKRQNPRAFRQAAAVPVPTVLDNYFDYNTSEKDDYIVRDNGDGTYYVKYPDGVEAIHNLTQITNLGLTPT